MRLLLFSDLHCDAQAARRLVEQADQVDVVVGAGDFATTRQGIDITLSVLSEISCPAVVVPGNSESDDELREACGDWPSAHVLHGSGVAIGGVEFFGLGAAVPVTPFGDWSFDLSEEQAAKLLKPCPSRAVLVSHSPPQGVVDRARGDHLGSTALRDAIQRTEPRLVVCGHIHSCWGQQETLGITPVVNAGPDGVIWDLE